MSHESDIQNHCRNYLPHFENQRYQMITYRLYDSLPKDIIDKWKEEVGIGDGVQAACQPNSADEPSAFQQLPRFENIADEPSTLQHQRKLLLLIDKYEDQGYGECFLRNDNVAQIVKDNLMFHNGKKYNLLCWCIMPNHVHVLVEMFSGISLSEVLHSWRSYTAHQINRVLNRTGQVWMAEYFDRYIRDYNHYQKVVNYIHNNPVKAGFVSSPQEYRWSSAFQ